MNAKNYGVAQSRNRTIAVSILGDYEFKFPEGYPLDKVMKDYLQDEVDEKYYLKSDKARELIDKLIIGGKIPTDRQTDRQTVDLCSQQAETVEIANCITARYDAGIVNHKYEHSGVCEISRIYGERNRETSK